MSRVTVTIDRLVVSGLDPAQLSALVAALESELARVLSAPAVSRRTPVLRLGRVPLAAGPAGARAIGQGIARAIAAAAGQAGQAGQTGQTGPVGRISR